MARKLKVKPFHGRQKIVGVLDDGVAKFNEVINKYCSEKGSHNTILGWGNEKTFLSIFSQGLIKNNCYCFLETPSPRTVKNADTDEEESKQGRVDAILIKRLGNKALAAIIEAKAVKPYITEGVTEANIIRTVNAIKEAKTQLWGIDPQDTYFDEEFCKESDINRIALVFTVLRAKFAKSGEGENMEWYDTKAIRQRAKSYFDALNKTLNNTVNKTRGDNILNYEAFIHSNTQLNLIKEYYGTAMMTEDGKVIGRPHLYTYYGVGVMITAANFQ